MSNNVCSPWPDFPVSWRRPRATAAALLACWQMPSERRPCDLSPQCVCGSAAPPTRAASWLSHAAAGGGDGRVGCATAGHGRTGGRTDVGSGQLYRHTFCRVGAAPRTPTRPRVCRRAYAAINIGGRRRQVPARTSSQGAQFHQLPCVLLLRLPFPDFRKAPHAPFTPHVQSKQRLPFPAFRKASHAPFTPHVQSRQHLPFPAFRKASHAPFTPHVQSRQRLPFPVFRKASHAPFTPH
eukprot:215547-Chlamydomonas_euryale.AAC.1